ncbi:hypothetical protein GS436_23640 [Rhodococcus hoagii]|nr:hypothetical protein [Prescottella equi]
MRSVHLLDDGGTLFTSKTRTHPLALDDILTEPPLRSRATSPSTRQT